DAFELQTLADIDAGWAYLDADVAVDAIAQALAARIDRARPRPTRFAARPVVSDDQRVAVEHHALEARIWTHVLADLLAHEPRVAEGREAVEKDPERFPSAEVPRGDVEAELADRREIANERVAGPQRDDEPGDVLGRFVDELLDRARRPIEPHARHPVAF